jgi:HK97 family phage major capsid protein
MNQDVEEQLPQMAVAVGTGGIPVYLPPSGLVGQPNNGGLYGRPVTPIEQCSELGEVGDVIFADFSQYLMIEKGGIQQAESIHVYFLTNQRVFRFVYRVDGQPQWDTPLLSANGTTKRSPFVTLAQRT